MPLGGLRHRPSRGASWRPVVALRPEGEQASTAKRTRSSGRGPGRQPTSRPSATRSRPPTSFFASTISRARRRPRLKMQPVMPAGGFCGTKPCWKARGDGWIRLTATRFLTPSGITKAKLGTGGRHQSLRPRQRAGSRRRRRRGRRRSFGQVTVQLRSSTSPVCLQADLPGAGAGKREGTLPRRDPLTIGRTAVSAAGEFVRRPASGASGPGEVAVQREDRVDVRVRAVVLPDHAALLGER